jgi:hypothetical protein
MTDLSPMPQRRRRHLIDPDAPRPVRDPLAEQRLGNVQKWVLSSLAVTTILHMSGGLVLASLLASETTAQIGLNVIGAAFGVLAVGTGLAIHRHTLLTPWILLGLLPGIVGIWLALR